MKLQTPKNWEKWIGKFARRKSYILGGWSWMIRLSPNLGNSMAFSVACLPAKSSGQSGCCWRRWLIFIIFKFKCTSKNQNKTNRSENLWWVSFWFEIQKERELLLEKKTNRMFCCFEADDVNIASMNSIVWLGNGGIVIEDNAQINDLISKLLNLSDLLKSIAPEYGHTKVSS